MSFRLPSKIRFYVKFYHSLQEEKKFAAKHFELWVTLKSNCQTPAA